MEQPKFSTDCELQWIKIKLQSKKDLYIGNLYMPHWNMNDINELDKSLQYLFNNPNSKNVLLLGDFNCPSINWPNSSIPMSAPDKNIQQCLIDVTMPNLTQIHNSPTRENNILDLVFTTNPTLIKSSISIPGISDHEAILTDVDIIPKLSKKKQRKIFKYSQATWDQITKDVTKCS